ncbi:MAG: acyl-CoA dehydrogenase family protein [Acidimicrobiales bacterium]
MDFDWADEQREFYDTVVRFATHELAYDVAQADADCAFPREAWERCAKFGIQSLALPEAYGGSDADVLTLICAMEALGYGCRDGGLLFSLSAHMWACQDPIVRFGNDEQKERWLPGLGDGSLIAAHAMSEPESGSDAFKLRSTLRREGEGFVLNGSKTFCSNAPVADVFLVFATVDATKGFFGVTALLLPRDTPGLTVGPPLHKMGLRTSLMSELFFDDCEVPADCILGRVGGGMMVFTQGMERERSLILASTIGTMQRGLERTIEHAKTRQQFGAPIGKNQAVSHRIVEMRLRLETARLLLYRLGWLADQGRPTALEASMVKLYLSEVFVQNSMDGLQLHGGYGYMAEYDLERDVRDALGARIYSGTSEIQRNIAAHLLGL